MILSLRSGPHRRWVHRMIAKWHRRATLFVLYLMLFRFCDYLANIKGAVSYTHLTLPTTPYV